MESRSPCSTSPQWALRFAITTLCLDANCIWRGDLFTLFTLKKPHWLCWPVSSVGCALSSLFSLSASHWVGPRVYIIRTYAFSRTDNGAPNFFFPLPFLTALFSRLVRFWRPGHDLSRKIRDLSTLTQRVSIFMYNRFVICSLSVPSRINFIIFRIESRVWVTRTKWIIIFSKVYTG